MRLNQGYFLNGEVMGLNPGYLLKTFSTLLVHPVFIWTMLICEQRNVFEVFIS